MTSIFISIGSNIDRQQHIRGAIQALHQRYGPLQCSAVYESEAVGFDGDNFYNLVVGAATTQTIEQVIAALRAIEQQHGRQRDGVRYSSRTLDLDLLLYGDVIRHDDQVDIPRDEIEHYAFVLQPLAEIAPQQRHPERGLSYADLWQQFDKSELRQWRTDIKFIHAPGDCC